MLRFVLGGLWVGSWPTILLPLPLGKGKLERIAATATSAGDTPVRVVDSEADLMEARPSGSLRQMLPQEVQEVP